MLDTNVLISTIIFPGEGMSALIRKITVEHQLVLSSYVEIEKPEILTPSQFLKKY
jgi:predicted nucleic acid-binding protein